MSDSRLMYVAQRPGNNRDTAAKMAAAARRGREREARERREAAAAAERP